MKYIYFFLIISVSWACTSEKSDNDSLEITQAKKITINWEKEKRNIQRAIDRYYIDNTLKQQVLTMPFDDILENRHWEYKIKRIDIDSLYVIDDKKALVKVLAYSDMGKDTLIFDYEVAYKLDGTKTDSAYFEVSSIHLRSINNRARYQLSKEGDKWTKILAK